MKYVVLDFETTGFTPPESEIIEIGALKVNRWQIEDRFQVLVKPLGKVPLMIEQLTGITNDLLEDQEDLEQVRQRFLHFMEDLPVVAHHSRAAEYDTNKPIEFTGGVVKVVEWTNPHIWTQVEVTGSDGKVVIYRVESGAPNPTFRRGWRKDSVKPGTIVNFKGIQARNPASTNLNGEMKLPDGRIAFGGSPEN